MFMLVPMWDKSGLYFPISLITDVVPFMCLKPVSTSQLVVANLGGKERILKHIALSP